MRPTCSEDEEFEAGSRRLVQGEILGFVARVRGMGWSHCVSTHLEKEIPIVTDRVRKSRRMKEISPPFLVKLKDGVSRMLPLVVGPN